MKKRVIVISLGGSLIIPNEADVVFLKKFREVIKNNTEKYKFVIVCGGGSIARKYINALREIGVNEKLQSMSGISATRMNARFMTYFFGEDAGQGIPHDMKKVRNMLLRNNIVFCGALRYEPKQTSDATAAKLANYFKTEFINLTNVQGLHDKNPKKFKNAKFIPFISWKDFDRMANKEEYKPGQHFVLDQTASKIILKNKITTYILGKDLRQLNSLLKNRKFTGTVIKG
jgi:uridylate kinase